ncbi:MAG: molecular chaperone GrpE [Candidatus Binatota bacterium]|nr:molecular chaperone GrpE [Candidatus Binatota bacterium]
MKRREDDLDRGADAAGEGARGEAEAGGSAGGGEAVGAGQGKIAELEALLREKEGEAKTNQERYLRELAESENFKKRLQREKVDSIRFANENILRDLIPIVDNLERAVEHADLGGDGKSLVEGVAMTLRLFRDVLERFGVKELNVEPGTTFDPRVHEASEIASRPDLPANAVVAQRSKGYLLNDRLLRPAQVVVASPHAAGGPPEGSGH